MRLAYVSFATCLLLASVGAADQTSMWWWHQNGDSVVLGGVTISLSGTGIQSADGAVHDPPGAEDATFTFTFDPPIDSFQMFVQSVGASESIAFEAPYPSSIQGPSLVGVGTPIQSVHGFFPGGDNWGAISWTGPGITSVHFTMAHADGSIELTQMGQATAEVLGNSIQMQATAAAGGVELDLAISDAGALPDVHGFVIERRTLYPCHGVEVQPVQCILSRQPGTVTHLSVLDASAEPGTQYLYEVLGTGFVPCSPDANQDAFRGAFDPTGWGFEIVSFASFGPDPVPIAHGRVVAIPEYGPSAVQIDPCPDSCNPYSGWVSEDVLQYVGTETEVLLYGSIHYSGNAYGYTTRFDSAVPALCTTAVTTKTWSQLKVLYRDAAP